MQHQLVINELFDETDDNDYGGMDCNLYNSIVNFKKTGKYPTMIEDHQKMSRNALFHWRMRCAKFMLSSKDTLLYVDKQNSKSGRVVVKRGEVKIAIKVVHERNGHVGQKQTQNLISRKLYWHGMRKDVARYINECSFCQTLKAIKKPKDICLNLPNEEVRILDRLQLNINVSNITNLTPNFISGKITPSNKETNNDIETMYSKCNQKYNKKMSMTLNTEPLGIDSMLVSAHQQSDEMTTPWLGFSEYDCQFKEEYPENRLNEPRKRKFSETAQEQASGIIYQDHVGISDDFPEDENFIENNSEDYSVDPTQGTQPFIVQAVDKDVIKLQKHYCSRRCYF
ncbi:unnamed protein product [Auanema sp. JU1783]|nr:unnamed protein product [Auanema sp. JU1783]